MHLLKEVTKNTYLEFCSYERNVQEIISKIKQAINKEDCKYLIVDIVCLNVMDATKVCILASTYHFSRYPDGFITWKIKDKLTQKTINMLKLKNIKTEISQRIVAKYPIPDYLLGIH